MKVAQKLGKDLTQRVRNRRGGHGLPLQLLITMVVCAVVATAQAQPTYTNPIIGGDFPDPSVIRVGEEYWATATSGGWAPHFPLLLSRDLVNWNAVGAVFMKTPAWAKGDFWAPEISEDRGRFYVYYTARRDEGPGKKGTLCVAVATATTPSGPYIDHGPLVCQNIGSIDAMTVRDENNQRYLIWKEDGNDRKQPTPIWAQPLSEDGLKLSGKRTEILRNKADWEGIATEGSFILKHGDWFYHFYSGNACCGRGCNYALGVARSRKLLGPWERNPANPILSANDVWQCPGHGSIVTAPDGRTFLLYHSYRRRADAFNIGREALLDEVNWNADAWPTINNGKGPGKVATSPFGVVQKNRTGFLDEFESRIDGSWQWPMSSQQTVGEEDGFLRLQVGANRNVVDSTLAIFAQRTISGDYVATTSIDLASMSPRTSAGLAAYGWRNWALGIAVGDGKVSVWRREGDKKELFATKDLPAANSIDLRMTVRGGEKYSFAFSSNGQTSGPRAGSSSGMKERGSRAGSLRGVQDWQEIGPAVDGSYIEGARVALTVGGPAQGVARFGWLKIEDSQK